MRKIKLRIKLLITSIKLYKTKWELKRLRKEIERMVVS